MQREPVLSPPLRRLLGTPAARTVAGVARAFGASLERFALILQLAADLTRITSEGVTLNLQNCQTFSGVTQAFSRTSNSSMSEISFTGGK